MAPTGAQVLIISSAYRELINGDAWDFQLLARCEPGLNRANDFPGPPARCSKSIAALATLAFLGALPVALPYISQVEAGRDSGLGRGRFGLYRERLLLQTWPNISSRCLCGDQLVDVRLREIAVDFRDHSIRRAVRPSGVTDTVHLSQGLIRG